MAPIFLKGWPTPRFKLEETHQMPCMPKRTNVDSLMMGRSNPKVLEFGSSCIESIKHMSSELWALALLASQTTRRVMVFTKSIEPSTTKLILRDGLGSHVGTSLWKAPMSPPLWKAHLLLPTLQLYHDGIPILGDSAKCSHTKLLTCVRLIDVLP